MRIFFKRCYLLFFKSPGIGVGNGGRVVIFAGVGVDVVVVAVVVVGGAVVVVTKGSGGPSFRVITSAGRRLMRNRAQSPEEIQKP